MTALLGPLLAVPTGNLLDTLAEAIEDLDDNQLHALPIEGGTSPGFNAWHVFRSADNMVHFVCYGEPPIWRQQGLDEQWGLPRNQQGTDMPLEEVQAMRFPGGQALARYGREVRAAIVPRIEAMDDEFLLGTMTARTARGTAERQRAGTLAQVIVAHGNQHLGQLQLLRQLLGKGGDVV